MGLCTQAIQRLNDLYVKEGNAGALRDLLTELRPLFAVIPKAKTAKIVRTIIETIAKVPNSTQLQVRGTVPDNACFINVTAKAHSDRLPPHIMTLNRHTPQSLCILTGGMRMRMTLCVVNGAY